MDPVRWKRVYLRSGRGFPCWLRMAAGTSSMLYLLFYTVYFDRTVFFFFCNSSSTSLLMSLGAVWCGKVLKLSLHLQYDNIHFLPRQFAILTHDTHTHTHTHTPPLPRSIRPLNVTVSSSRGHRLALLLVSHLSEDVGNAALAEFCPPTTFQAAEQDVSDN